MIEVWHAKAPTFGLDLSERGRPAPVWPVDFHKVAEVATYARETAFERTQHIDHNWRLNPDVIPFVQEARSSAIGDVLITEDRKPWAIGATGFYQISEGDPVLLRDVINR